MPSSMADALLTYGTATLTLWLHTARRRGWVRLEGRDGLVIWPEEVAHLVERMHPDFGHENDSDLPSPGLLWRAFVSRWNAALEAGDEVAARWQELQRRLGLADAEVQLLAVQAAMSTSHALQRGFRYGWSEHGRTRMPLGFATTLLADPHEGPTPEALASTLSPLRGRLFQLGLLELDEGHGLDRGIAMPDETALALTSVDFGLPELVRHDDAPPVPVGLGAMLRRRLPSILAAVEREHAAAVVGPPGSGRLAVAGQLAQVLNPSGGLFVLDVTSARAFAPETCLARAVRCAALYDATLVVTELDTLQDPRRAEWVARVRDVARSTPTLSVVWILEQQPDAAVGVPPNAVLELTFPTRDRRADVWSRLLAGNDRLAARLGSQFLLTEGQIERAAARGKAAVSAPDDLEEALQTAARAEAALGIGRLASPEIHRATLDQLIVTQETRTLLRELLAYARHRDELAEAWGFAKKIPYGLGVAALFSGPPGTGKTMAATAIANALDLELYRVDLSRLVSKYIGETEKHLEQVFAAAESGEVMLLFDEADSLFGKRTEVKSSVDRYANLEINFLLQRMERFSGIVILTTNFEAGLDEAFARRIRFRVHFDEPDREARETLWRSMIPPQVPLDDDVDFEELAAVYELSGGHIKEVVLRAASIALAEGRDVSMELLELSADAEYRKLGKLAARAGDGGFYEQERD